VAVKVIYFVQRLSQCFFSQWPPIVVLNPLLTRDQTSAIDELALTDKNAVFFVNDKIQQTVRYKMQQLPPSKE